MLKFLRISPISLFFSTRPLRAKCPVALALLGLLIPSGSLAQFSSEYQDFGFVDVGARQPGTIMPELGPSQAGPVRPRGPVYTDRPSIPVYPGQWPYTWQQWQGTPNQQGQPAQPGTMPQSVAPGTSRSLVSPWIYTPFTAVPGYTLPPGMQGLYLPQEVLNQIPKGFQLILTPTTGEWAEKLMPPAEQPRPVTPMFEQPGALERAAMLPQRKEEIRSAQDAPTGFSGQPPGFPLQPPPVLAVEQPLQLFGYDFFQRNVDGFNPIPQIPAPAEYPLGPGDTIRVTMTSPVGQETDLALDVDTQGRVRIPNVGYVRVAGLNISAAEDLISRTVRARFPRLNAQASLLNVRPIQVFVVGEVKNPGSFVLPGLSTLLNALYQAGGPTQTGSLRRIRVERNRQVVAEMDVYDLLLRGERGSDIALQSGDTVFVPAIGPTITVKGEVRRPAIYELKGQTTIRQALQTAGGPGGRASLANVRIERVLGASRTSLIDLRLSDERSADWDIALQHGDEVVLNPVLADAVNRVEIAGAVKRPGQYELTAGLTLSGLIQRAEGFIDEEVFLDRAHVVRLEEDGRPSLLSADLGAAMSGDEGLDFPLKARDRVYVYTKKEAASLNRIVLVRGEVQRPGPYDRKEGMTVRDLVVGAGGLSPTAHNKAEIGRVVPSTGELSAFLVDLDKALAGDPDHNLVLVDGDQLLVRNIRDARSAPQTVRLEGEVSVPGIYPLMSRDESLSSVIARAGGLTRDAFPDGAVFVRQTPALISRYQQETATEVQESMRDFSEQIRELQLAQYGITRSSGRNPQQTAASTGAAAMGLAGVFEDVGRLGTSGPVTEVNLDETRKVAGVTSTSRVPIDLKRALSEIGGDNDIPLEDGDIIFVPKRPTVVSVAGAVTNPNVVVFRPGERVEYYIRKVGDYARDADRGATVVVRANGEVIKARDAREVLVGDIIIVPPKPLTAPRRPLENVSEILRIVANAVVAVAVISR